MTPDPSPNTGPDDLCPLPERPQLLVVDDQPINIQTLYEIFSADHEVFFATSGEEALAFCRRSVPDLILLDIVMPGMDGLAVCRALKADAETRDVPIIFVTAQSDPADETRALQAGGVDFISKPVNPLVVRARVRTHLMLKAQSDLLRSLAFIDGLTGVANRRRFDEALQAEWRRSRRQAYPLALLMMDIDHFKSYNDLYGHQAGDGCLRAVARALREPLSRAHDLLARYGGEEFACLVPECEVGDALRKAEALRSAVRALAIPHAGSPTADRVTLSVGVAVLAPDDAGEPEALLQAADAALYEAKRLGRDRVACAPAAGAGPNDGGGASG